MTKTLKIVLLVLAIVAVGGYFYPLSIQRTITQVQNYGSSAGTSFNTAKFAGVVFGLSSSSATTTSIYNTDSFDRKIQSFVADCSGVGTSLTAYTGAGLSQLVFTAATTSTAAPNTITNTNTMALPIATSTVDSYNSVGSATTTPTALSRVWKTGTYWTISSNATNTAACTVGVNYIGS